MAILSAIFGIIFAFVAVGALGIVALFISCDLAAEEDEKKSHANKKNH
jgi:hypothetical protein